MKFALHIYTHKIASHHSAQYSRPLNIETKVGQLNLAQFITVQLILLKYLAHVTPQVSALFCSQF